MTQEYTPTDTEIKDGYVHSFCSANNTNYWWHFKEIGEGDFDRWLAAHDAQIRAEAWEEGRIAEHDEANGWGDAINPYRKEQK